MGVPANYSCVWNGTCDIQINIGCPIEGHEFSPRDDYRKLCDSFELAGRSVERCPPHDFENVSVFGPRFKCCKDGCDQEWYIGDGP